MDEDLKALVDLFNLTVTGEDMDVLSKIGSIPNIDVEGKNGTVTIAKVRNDFWITGEVKGVPTRYFGHGHWQFIIDI